MSLKTSWKVLFLGAMFAFLAFFFGQATAQGNGTKPVHLITGDVILQAIPPDQVQVSPDAVFDGKYFRIIQFRELPTYEMRKQWENKGLYLVDYLPDDAYFAVIDQKFDLRELSEWITTIAPVSDEFRFEPAFAAMKQAMSAQGPGRFRDRL